MTAAGVVSAVRKRLALLVSDEFPGKRLSRSFRNEVDHLNSQLGNIECILMKNMNENFIVPNREEALQLACDLEDAAEYLYLQQEQPQALEEAQPPSSSIRFMRLSKSKTNSKLPSPPQGDLRVFREKMDDLCNRCVKINAGRPLNDFVVDRYIPSETTVGIKDDMQLLYLLLNDIDGTYPSAANSIWICGMSGIGKTTLARQLFESPSVLMKFNGRAWVRVGQNFQARDIAASILLQLSSSESSKEEIQAVETTELMERLHKAQVQRKCLVVLDDVRSVQAWETMRFAFASESGTRIVITTDLREEAEMAKGYIHDMKLLNEEHSWELFKTQLSVKDLVAIQKLPIDERENIVKKVVSRSGGLPLALTILGGMSRGEFLDWFETLQTLPEQSNQKFEEVLENILSSSYKCLPFQLKSCVLYLGLFPDDQVIPVDKLCLIWMAEGLISTSSQGDETRTGTTTPTGDQGDEIRMDTSTSKGDQGDETRMDVAEAYLNALVQRRLVMVQNKDFTGVTKAKLCELHDWIRKTCRLEGKKEGFVRIMDLEQGENLSPTRKIAIYLDYPETLGSLKILSPKHIRSILFFVGDGFPDESIADPGEVVDLTEFRWTRVLDFDKVDFLSRKLPIGIEKLVYLRYLSFRGCHLQELPSSFITFPFLETLDLLVTSSCEMIIPNILWKMSCLLHLYFPLSFKSAADGKLQLGGLTRLETLENFHASFCNVEDLESLQNLRIFRGIADGSNDDVNKMVRFVESQQRLRGSSLSIRNFDCYSSERVEIVTELLRCDHLQSLDIDGHIGELQRHVGSDLKNFTEIIFNASEFDKDPMPILGMFPHLRSLVLCNDAFLGKEMVFIEESFPNLRCLKLSNLWFVEELIVESGAMPCLSSLNVEQCRNLKSLPENLMEISTLQEVKIRHMAEKFLQLVLEMAEYQQASGSKVVVRHFL